MNWQKVQWIRNCFDTDIFLSDELGNKYRRVNLWPQNRIKFAVLSTDSDCKSNSWKIGGLSDRKFRITHSQTLSMELKVINSGGSKRAPTWKGYQPIIWPKFVEKWWKWRKLDRVARPKFHYVDPQLIKMGLTYCLLKHRLRSHVWTEISTENCTVWHHLWQQKWRHV